MPKHNPEKLTNVTIEVTDRLIKKGVPNDTYECPVALALKKVIAKGVELSADYEDITLSVNVESEVDFDAQVVITPARVSKFMEKMDARDSDLYTDDGETEPLLLPPLPKPFSFKIKVLNKFLRPGLRT